MLKKFLPQEHKIFVLFSNQTRIIRQGIDTFSRLVSEYDRQGELTCRIKELEHEADGVAHQIFQLLNSVFVTPFDREDIQLLAYRMDDVMDAVEKAGGRMQIYALTAPPPFVKEMTETLKEAFGKIALALEMLKNLKHREAILQHCVNVNSIENHGDMLLEKALEHLFRQPSDPIYVIKAKEIYESLEQAIDRCEDLADIIETIILKNT